jgi:hypothetical protein
MEYEKDYYQILDVKPSAPQEEIKQAYRRLAKINLSAKKPTRETSVRIQEINEAYSVLSNKHKRMRYDLECKNSSTSTQTFAISNNTTTENLEQFFYKKTNVEFILLAIAICTSILSIFGILSSSYFGAVLTGASLLSSIFITFGVLFWRHFKSQQKEKQCPKCGKLWAAENLGERPMGIFQKWRHSQEYNEYYFKYLKYKIHYKCNYCSYEWLCIKTRRL